MSAAPEAGATIDRERLAKLCGMFGSDHEGERANAAAAADRLVRQAGLRWPDVIAAPRLAPPSPELDPIRDPFGAARFCLDFRVALSVWEAEFCRGVGLQAAAGRRLSDKQFAILGRILQKCRLAAREA